MKSSDSVETYLNEIRTVPLLTKEEEIGLAKSLEDCRIAIVSKLLDTGVLTDEIRKLKSVLTKTDKTPLGDSLTKDVVHDDSGMLTEGEYDSNDLLNIIEEIIDICERGRERG